MNGALADRRIVNTRAVHQAGALDNLLRARGAVPLSYPCIAITPPHDPTALDSALSELADGGFDWLVLTSPNTVSALAQRLSAGGLALAGAAFQTAALGPATAAAAQAQLGLSVMGLPVEYTAEALAHSLPITPGARVLLPGSALARPALAEVLTTRGAAVRVVTAYQTVCGSGGIDMGELLAQRQIDALTFTSSSTVTCFLERLRREGIHPDHALSVYAVCIGPQTAATARDCGFTAVHIPSENTLEGLVERLSLHFSPGTSTRETS
jgi:uroporphyrinogen-III synthase